MSISQRIKLLVEHEKKQIDFAQKTGLKAGTISRVINKGSSVNSETLEAIIRAYPNLNPLWLLTGEGNMWLTEKEQEELRKSIQSNQKSDMAEEMIDLLKKRVNELEREIKAADPGLAEKLNID